MLRCDLANLEIHCSSLISTQMKKHRPKVHVIRVQMPEAGKRFITPNHMVDENILESDVRLVGEPWK